MQYLIDDLKNHKSLIYNMKKTEKNKVYIMRDDLIPFSFGGNKARKAIYFINDIVKNKFNYIITYGSASSNHCRIIANIAKIYNFSCTIITTEKEKTTNNKIMCEIFGVEFVYCDISNVKKTIDEQIKLKTKMGYKPYFIQGGGHGNWGTQAYIDAFNDIIKFEKENNMKFDYIFHASGTGTTQAGLIIGKSINKSEAKIIGISIARKLPRGKEIIIESIKDYVNSKKLDYNITQQDIGFIDKYICDGYGKYDIKIKETIIDVLKNEGIPLDPTYTGKAFYGMKQYIKENKIEGKNILFIHTGGTPIFFDFLKEENIK